MHYERTQHGRSMKLLYTVANDVIVHIFKQVDKWDRKDGNILFLHLW